MRIPVVPTVISLCCVSILLGLGTWQIKRLAWKNEIIERLQADYKNTASSPLSAEDLDRLAQERDPLAYGTVKGKILRKEAVLLGPRTEDGRMGYNLLLPVEFENGKMLIVNTGWVSDLWRDNLESRLAGFPAGRVLLHGIIRKPDWSALSSKNSPANDLWFRADISDITTAKNIKNPYPFILYVDKTSPEFPDVRLHQKEWLPRNKHLQYALFWYVLAGVMAGVYVVYVRGLEKNERQHLKG